MKNILYFLVVIAFLLGCGPVTPVAQPTITITPIIEFQRPNIWEYSKEVVEQDGVELTVWVSSLNTDIAFLFGGMSDRNYFTVQSTLLRSSDGGRHWKEVMAPISESDVQEFTIFESGTGWALVRTPYPDDYTRKYILFQTTDKGTNWKEISVIPLSPKESSAFVTVLQMIFTDEKNGQIDLLYEESLGGYVEFLTTNDGGLHWTQAGVYRPNFDFKANAQILDSYRKLGPDKSLSNNPDHSGLWSVFGEYGNPDIHEIIISRYIFNEKADWTIEKTSIPKHFDYKDGQIIIP